MPALAGRTTGRAPLSASGSPSRCRLKRRQSTAGASEHPLISIPFALHFTDYQRSSPLYGQLICQANHSDCLPSPCGRLSRPRTTTEAPPACTSSGAHSLNICASLPQFTCLDSIARAKLPVAVFILACRKSSQISRSSCALPVMPCWSAPVLRPAFAASVPTCDRRRSTSCLLSGVGKGDDSTLRCVQTGSYPSTVSCSAWRLILA